MQKLNIQAKSSRLPSDQDLRACMQRITRPSWLVGGSTRTLLLHGLTRSMHNLELLLLSCPSCA